MPRFFVNNEDIENGKIYIRGENAYHIARSLRMAAGDSVTVSDGERYEYECKLTKIRDELCECDIISSAEGKSEPAVKITLYMGYPKGDKLEQVVQKAVELGVSEIVPFESSRCIKRPKEERREKQMARLNKIAIEAAKQCGRLVIPKVCDTVSFSELISVMKGRRVLFCYEGEGCISLKEALSYVKEGEEISVVIGSEGGFSESEAESARESGAFLCNLGPRILRCETAPAYILSAISYQFEL